jgi:hypothetical protein
MKAIVMLFTNKTKTDSEEYIYPNIEKVRVTIEGVPNAVYSQGIPKTRLYEEARRLFGTDEISHQTYMSSDVSLIDLYKCWALEKVGSVIDLYIYIYI